MSRRLAVGVVRVRCIDGPLAETYAQWDVLRLAARNLAAKQDRIVAVSNLVPSNRGVSRRGVARWRDGGLDRRCRLSPGPAAA